MSDCCQDRERLFLPVNVCFKGQLGGQFSQIVNLSRLDDLRPHVGGKLSFVYQ